ncbi:hypothetical protein PoB_005924700 [Plakobranchus ocellatus]|uniref:Uncharacterized protein n=1 Tax=Plakobranchus ocellatus TaxID=259542 RepID=A0AAV4CLJ5_9GAST|nr:hypothetical protein PoB_005924700 [Plakobranchus ocellatus]
MSQLDLPTPNPSDQSRQRQVKSAPPPLTGPSLTTRAGSPSSTGYDPESLLERLQEQGLAGEKLSLSIAIVKPYLKLRGENWPMEMLCILYLTLYLWTLCFVTTLFQMYNWVILFPL